VLCAACGGWFAAPAASAWEGRRIRCSRCSAVVVLGERRRVKRRVPGVRRSAGFEPSIDASVRLDRLSLVGGVCLAILLAAMVGRVLLDLLPELLDAHRARVVRAIEELR